MTNVKCTVSAFSRPGQRERNEDACGYVEQDGIVCCVLADGAGGHGGGDVASRTCVQSVLDTFASRPEASPDMVACMLQDANEAVLRRQESEEPLASMRSTLVVLAFDLARRIAVWGHVGDSRLYLFRNGTMHMRTRDHSLVQTMVDSGMLQPEQAQDHPDSSVLFTSLGLRDAFQPETLDTVYPLCDGDAFLLCSDGVWGTVPDIEFEQCLGNASTAQDWLCCIEQKVNVRLHPGSDNYSAIGVWCGDVGDNMRTEPRRIRLISASRNGKL